MTPAQETTPKKQVGPRPKGWNKKCTLRLTEERRERDKRNAKILGFKTVNAYRHYLSERGDQEAEERLSMLPEEAQETPFPSQKEEPPASLLGTSPDGPAHLPLQVAQERGALPEPGGPDLWESLKEPLSEKYSEQTWWSMLHHVGCQTFAKLIVLEGISDEHTATIRDHYLIDIEAIWRTRGEKRPILVRTALKEAEVTTQAKTPTPAPKPKPLNPLQLLVKKHKEENDAIVQKYAPSHSAISRQLELTKLTQQEELIEFYRRFPRYMTRPGSLPGTPRRALVQRFGHDPGDP